MPTIIDQAGGLQLVVPSAKGCASAQTPVEGFPACESGTSLSAGESVDTRGTLIASVFVENVPAVVTLLRQPRATGVLSETRIAKHTETLKESFASRADAAGFSATTFDASSTEILTVSKFQVLHTIVTSDAAKAPNHIVHVTINSPTSSHVLMVSGAHDQAATIDRFARQLVSSLERPPAPTGGGPSPTQYDYTAWIGVALLLAVVSLVISRARTKAKRPE